MRGKRFAAAEVPREIPRAAISRFAVADQRKMPHRRHRPPLGQADAAMFGGPVDQPRPGKFRPPAEPARQRRERQFEERGAGRFRRRCD